MLNTATSTTSCKDLSKGISGGFAEETKIVKGTKTLSALQIGIMHLLKRVKIIRKKQQEEAVTASELQNIPRGGRG